MKNMKSVFFYLGMGSCISTKNSDQIPPIATTTTTITMEKTVTNSVQPSFWKVHGTPSAEEQFFDSKAWLESDDEDFVSVNADNSPLKQGNTNGGDHQGRRLSDLFKDRSFSSDSQTSLKATEAATENKPKPTSNTPNRKLMRQISVKRCLPSLVRSLSCGGRKKRSTDVAVAG